MNSEFWYLRRKRGYWGNRIPFLRAAVIVLRRAWLVRDARKAREHRAKLLGGEARADVRRLTHSHWGMIRAQFDGCLVFLATVSLILIALIIAGMR